MTDMPAIRADTAPGTPSAPTQEPLEILSAGSPHATSFLTFAIAGQVFAVDVRHVRRILDPQPVSPLPGRDRGFIGLIDVAGESIPLADVDAALGLHVAALSASATRAEPTRRSVAHEALAKEPGDDAAAQGVDERRLLIVELGADRQPACLRADRVVDVIDVGPDMMEALPSTVASDGPMIGALRVAGDYILVVAIDRLFTTQAGGANSCAPSPFSRLAER